MFAMNRIKVERGRIGVPAPVQNRCRAGAISGQCASSLPLTNVHNGFRRHESIQWMLFLVSMDVSAVDQRMLTYAPLRGLSLKADASAILFPFAH
jgi:hypothetical protein